MKNRLADSSGKGLAGMSFFLLGMAIALAFGWGIFPNLLYVKMHQPLNFLHSAHQDSDCSDCHFTRDDGSYSGIPKIDTCIECHEEQQGGTKEERKLVEDYVNNEKEIPWLVYAWQPDNVYFSHIAHKEAGVKCVRCHRDVTKDKELPVFRRNRLTGYSSQTMKMVECEKCHADHGASNSCNVCHK